jgi:hypothetical protein
LSHVDGILQHLQILLEIYSRFSSVLQATTNVPCRCSSVSLSLKDPTMECRKEQRTGVMRAPRLSSGFQATGARQQDLSPAPGQGSAKAATFSTSHVTWTALEASRHGCNSRWLIGPAAAPCQSPRMGGRH